MESKVEADLHTHKCLISRIQVIARVSIRVLETQTLQLFTEIEGKKTGN